MKWLKRIVLIALGVPVVGIVGMYATGNGGLVPLLVGFVFGKPSGSFDPAAAVVAPDYSDPQYWAALPDRADLADLVPAGVAVRDKSDVAPVDVFFIHPTGFLKGSSWTYSMDSATSSEENTQWMMANQASAYNSCCNVYAPRYRQASIYAYFSGDEVRDMVLGFAYQDVARAFEYFLEHFNAGRPFIIASHSQGTHHGIQLLHEKISGTRLAQRMVAAYLIGGGLTRTQFSDMPDIAICDSPTQLHCAVHWDTSSVAAIEEESEHSADNLCVNPLTWKLDGGLAARDQHQGAVPGSGEFNLDIMGDDSARGVEFGPLGSPLVGFLEAQCAQGVLYVTDQSDTGFGARGAIGSNYHGLDYPLFHMDIRNNASLRSTIFLAAGQAQQIEESEDTEINIEESVQP